jgi:GH24 family phage-related lysozyme (muramidase)
VTATVKEELNPDQYSAMVSFAFSSGCTEFKQSTVVSALNAKQFFRVPSLLCKQTRSLGKQLGSLLQRRAVEASLFEGAQIKCNPAAS